LVQAFLKKWWVESDSKDFNMDLSNKKQYIIFKLLDDVIDITFPVQIT